MPRERQIRNGQRVRDLGEVFTQAKDVKAMVDMVSPDCLTLDSKVLEPSCGTCNFLVEIMRRKLACLDKMRLEVGSARYYQQALLAVSSMYGLDIDEKNIDESRKILADRFDAEMRKRTRKKVLPAGVRKALRVILNSNLIHTNALKPAHRVELVEYAPDGWRGFSRKVFRLRDVLAPRQAQRDLVQEAALRALPAVPYWNLEDAA